MNANKTAFLKLLSEADAQTYALSAAQEAVIGREPDCQVVLDSTKYGGVSRRHALIRYQPESLSFEISDLGSSNGTFVNGQRLLHSQLLRSGDRIQLGTSGVAFSFDDPSLPLTVVQSPPHQGGAPVTMPADPAAADLPAISPVPTASPAAASELMSKDNKDNTVKIIGIAGIVAGALIVALLAMARTGLPGFLRDRSSSPNSPDSSSSPVSPVPTASQQSSPSTSPDTAEPSHSPANSAAGTQTLTDANGLFQVELPVGYQTERRDDGINLASADGSFQGAITAVRTPQPFTTGELIEGFTNQQTSNSNLQNFTIQNTETIEEGVRIDWVARLLSVNSELDAVTHFLQQDNVVVEIDLFSVDRPFSQQDAEEANVILRSLRITP